jgi:hypothetical protein
LGLWRLDAPELTEPLIRRLRSERLAALLRPCAPDFGEPFLRVLRRAFRRPSGPDVRRFLRSLSELDPLRHPPDHSVRECLHTLAYRFHTNWWIRRHFRQSQSDTSRARPTVLFPVAIAAAAAAFLARPREPPTDGVGGAEIKIGQTMPDSGPVSAYGAVGAAPSLRAKRSKPALAQGAEGDVAAVEAALR